LFWGDYGRTAENAEEGIDFTTETQRAQRKAIDFTAETQRKAIGFTTETQRAQRKAVDFTAETQRNAIGFTMESLMGLAPTQFQLSYPDPSAFPPTPAVATTVLWYSFCSRSKGETSR
jgi:hypothetical protein